MKKFLVLLLFLLSATHYLSAQVGGNLTHVGGTKVSGANVVDSTATTFKVSGPDASGATPTGKPLQDGCIFLTTPLTLTNNQIGALQCDSAQNLLIKINGGSLAANQSVNIAQINGVTPLMGNGVTGTGSHRVTVASDNTGIANWGHGATGSAVPSGATYIGGNGSGNLKGIVGCDNWTNISLTANTQIITGSASKQTYICSINLVVGAATNVAVVEGTGSVCATGIAGIFGGTTAATGWNFAANGGIAQGSGLGAIGRTATAADNVCILVSAANQTSGNISWTQF